MLAWKEGGGRLLQHLHPGEARRMLDRPSGRRLFCNLATNTVNFQHTTRYRGWVTYFHNTDLFGFVTRDDLLEREYHFNATDLYTDGVAKLRVLQPVEFSVIETAYGRFIARDITGPNGQVISYAHQNSMLPREQQTKKLSDVPGPLDQTHTGVVKDFNREKGRGLIVPDRKGYEMCWFKKEDIKCTGRRELREFATVEFRTHATTTPPYQTKAYDIRRPGGGLITYENKELGGFRRALGAMYTHLDDQAHLPPDVRRTPGWVCEWRDDQLCGFVCSHENPYEKMFFHLDDCHMFGYRKMRHQQDVEFTWVKTQGQPFNRAIHVTGPGGAVLRYELPNYTALVANRNKTFEPNTGKRHLGVVQATVRGESMKDLYGFICPDEEGYKTAYFSRGDLRVADVHDVPEDCRVEFELRVNEENPDRLRATNITGPGGRLITNWKGTIGDFYRGRAIRHGTSKAAPAGERLYGFICQMNSRKRTGLIEATLADGGAYDRIHFRFDDLIAPEDAQGEQGAWIGSFVEFMVEALPDAELPFDGPPREPRRLATGIKTVGKSFYDPNTIFNFELLEAVLRHK